MTTTSDRAQNVLSGDAPADDSATGSPSLRGNLTTPRIVLLVVAAAAPLAATVGAVPLAFAYGNGAGVPAMYLLAGLVLLCFSVGYAAMSRRVDGEGGFYGYLRAGFGRTVAGAGGGVAVLAYNAAAIGLVACFGYFTSLALGHVGLAVPWELCAGIALALIAVFGYRRIDLSARLLGVLMVGEIGVVTALVVGVAVAKGADAFPAASFSPGVVSQGAVGVSMMFAFMSFIGFESAAAYAGETVNPRRTVPTATYASVATIALLYALVSWVTVGGVGADRIAAVAGAQSGDLVLGLAGQYVAGWFGTLVQVLLCTSLFAAALALHNAANRYTFVLGAQGVLPRVLGRAHPRHGAPSVACVVNVVLAAVVLAGCAVAGLDPYTDVTTTVLGLGTVGLVVLQSAAALAVPAFFARAGGGHWWRTLLAPALGAIGLVVSAVLLVANFGLLAGGTENPLVGALPWALVVAAVAGALGALRSRARV